MDLATRIAALRAELARLQMEFDELVPAGEVPNGTPSPHHQSVLMVMRDELMARELARSRKSQGPADAEIAAVVGQNISRRVLDVFLSQPGRVFDAREVAELVGADIKTIRTLLSRLTHGREISRPAFGRYRLRRPGDVDAPEDEPSSDDAEKNSPIPRHLR